MTALWSEAELKQVLGAPTAPLKVAVGGVSIDSRTLAAGDLFIAIKGEAHDGHDHVAAAFEAGAAAAVAARQRAGSLAAFGPVFAADGTLNAMERLAHCSRERARAKVAA
ncbi:MAG: UDP-N-acetylmuramoylalanyl-D-glutamyl-2, 6-diaminopimelate--D-alanyl-D-alanine ligase, partial [Hyphomicrobiales bacterium]|nr:UDP-N-acetylmuramoylalanyl-D-glutamyl-2, 6-diaminopimelate--D-alanyl-D-alanine ligase [Hyphomicrobiales bacterium]